MPNGGTATNQIYQEVFYICAILIFIMRSIFEIISFNLRQTDLLKKWLQDHRKFLCNTNFNNSKDIFVIEDIFRQSKATFTRFTDKFLTEATFTNLLGKINIK